MVTPGSAPQDMAVLREAGKLAVGLLKQLASMLPLRSDTPQIEEEIARVENIFGVRILGDNAARTGGLSFLLDALLNDVPFRTQVTKRRLPR